MKDLQTDPRYTLLQLLKGNDIKVLIAMGLLGGVNIGNVEIKECCGLHLATIKNCLLNLSAKGLVTQTHRTDGWQITEGGRGMLFVPEPSHTLCDSEAIINIDTPLNTLRLKDSNTNNTEPSHTLCDSEILKALHLMGIYDPTAVKLAQMEHITQEYIASWKLALDAGIVGKGGKDIPLAIHLMVQKATAPEPKKEGWEKYIDGEYSEFIQH